MDTADLKDLYKLISWVLQEDIQWKEKNPDADMVLGTCQIDQDNLHKWNPVECMGFGKAISNITLELKLWSYIMEQSPQRARVWIE